MTITSLEPLSTVVAGAIPALVILLKITCVLLAALGATLLMPRASAGSRHLVWLVSVTALLILPPLAVWGPLPLPVLPQAFSPSAVVQNTDSPGGTQGTDLQTGSATKPSVTLPWAGNPTAAASVESSLTVSAMLFYLWLAVAAALLLRLVYGAWSVRRIVRQARTLDHPDWQTPLYQIADRMGLAGAPQLLQSDEVKMPFAAGLFTHWIVLPAESESWTAERRSAVLIHELGHVRRRDLIGHTLGRVVSALYWFHPLVWTAARQLRAESERACDDLALVFGAKPSDYAEHLLDIVTCVRDHNTPAVALAMAHRKEFEGRMLAILNPDLRRRGPSRLQTAGLVGSLALLTVLVAAAAPVSRSTPPVVVTQAPLIQEPAPTELSRDTGRQPVALPAPAAKPRPAATPAQKAAPRPDEKIAPGDQPDDERAAVLAKTLRTDSSAQVRRVAAWGLQRYARTDVAQEALVAALTSDRDADVREMAAWALNGARHSATASAALVKAIKFDKDATVRATSVWAAGSQGDESAVEALVGVLADPDPDVRELAAWALGNCRPDQAPAGLVKALGDKESRVRLTTAWALYNIRDPQTVTAIDAAFRTETDKEVQRGLIRALGAMGDLSVDALQKLVSSPDPEVREVAVTALAGGGATGPWPWPWPQPRPFP